MRSGAAWSNHSTWVNPGRNHRVLPSQIQCFPEGRSALDSVLLELRFLSPIMGTHTVLFSRRYRAALLDYLLGAGEVGLARAYELGRRAIDEGIGLLSIVHAHQRAVHAVLESTPTASEALGRLEAAEMFLVEALSPFELTYRGYIDVVGLGRREPED